MSAIKYFFECEQKKSLYLKEKDLVRFRQQLGSIYVRSKKDLCLNKINLNEFKAINMELNNLRRIK